MLHVKCFALGFTTIDFRSAFFWFALRLRSMFGKRVLNSAYSICTRINKIVFTLIAASLLMRAIYISYTQAQLRTTVNDHSCSTSALTMGNKVACER